jgi:Glycoside hydrolase family 95, C-terminal domain
MADRFEPMMRNRLSLREGPGAIECERLGRIAEAVHTALLQSAPPHPGEDAIIRVFPAWPREWDASFKLLTRGAFLVSSSIKSGTIESVRIESLAGAECRLRNPWPDRRVQVFDVTDGAHAPVDSMIEAGKVRFRTSAQRSYHVAPKVP